MTRKMALIFASGLLAAVVPALAQMHTKPANRNAQESMSQPVAIADAAHGKRVFQQNCSRCHNAPQSFPPQISGTIVRHMRVRASLSANDERALLRFLNP
jgi:cytochrome c5